MSVTKITSRAFTAERANATTSALTGAGSEELVSMIRGARINIKPGTKELERIQRGR